MEYGMAFEIGIADFEKGEELSIVSMPGDYIRMSRWAEKGLPEEGGPESETVRIIQRNYALAWHALKRLGRLGELGLPEELDVAAIDAMADRLAIDVNELKGDPPFLTPAAR